ncbi:MAG TPA: phosphate ABC transporter permease subunit PstC [Thermoplasmata archaeon]|nr:phosphate ABC transporter permease subunit PstC [Thermoplasmata archaeon]
MASVGRTRSDQRLRLLLWFGRVFHGVTLATALAIGALLALLTGFLVWAAWPSIVEFGPHFLTISEWNGTTNVFGAAPAIVGTLVTSLLALLFAVPISLGVAIFLSELAPRWLRQPLVYVVDLSAAVPSVVYGFWAFIVLVPIMKSTVEPALGSITGGRFPFGPTTGLDVFTATIVLTVMTIPTISALSREALRAVPRINRESAWGLGATRWESTRMAVLGPARPGIAAAVMLGLGRAIGEAIAVAMVIGNIYILPGTLFSPGATLGSWIVNSYSELGPGLQSDALLELALILLAITVIINVVARLVLWRLADREAGDAGPTRPWPWQRTHSGAGAGSVNSATPGKVEGATVPTAWRTRTVERGHRRILRRRAMYGAVLAVTAFCVVLAVAPLASVVLTAVQNGGSAVVRPSFYTSDPSLGCNPALGACSYGGIGPEIQGTLIILGIGLLIAVPVGVLAGIYLAEYGRGRLGRAISFLADVMSGVPTIILGVFVFALFLYFDHYSALSAIAAGVGLGVLMIPIISRASEEALRSVPSGVREAALALGFPKYRVTVRVVLGTAKTALVTGVLLAASRAVGDTAIVLLTAGFSSTGFTGLNQQTATIPVFIFQNFGSPYPNLREDAWGAALVLLAIMLLISLVTRLAVRSPTDRAEGI